MNKKYLIFTILIVALVTSCSGDDEKEKETDVSLIGTWTGLSSSFNGNNSGAPDNSIVKFTSNKRTEFIYEGYGNQGQDISELGSWDKNGTILTITWDDADASSETYILSITELTVNSLKWETNISGEGSLKETFKR
ncbi:hypothetical protein [Mariniflexile sp. AS56]|uniref:hypothetical protein n=1 Tax=Mariniflexile sp. AS56 TaxID=3063957 RepID=UPI0026F026E9|nr:hypothetical protein [Mariniflexile sp. AS56]MDO7173703.1 hypothetical protein [Mariniflexile sp. AS56]